MITDVESTYLSLAGRADKVADVAEEDMLDLVMEAMELEPLP
jgi:hypothetical protein